MAEDADGWLSAAAAIALLKQTMPVTGRKVICSRAYDGLIRAKAERFVSGSEVRDNFDLPRKFWWAKGGSALEQNWASGDFETWIDDKHQLKAYGVTFARGDIEKLIPKDVQETPARSGTPRASSKVFIVHGRPEAPRESVARFLEKLGLQPIILHEQANQGRTVIEKFEANADVGFAVVLLTPDDTGGLDGQQQHRRARQNVILELGYFIGRMGRPRVCALKVGEVELPSDILGIAWTDLDGGGAWRIGLAKELAAAGYHVDWNKVMA